MMLTPEQLDAVRGEAEIISDCHPSKDARAFAKSALAALDAQQARIAELDGLLTSASNHCNETANERNELFGRIANLEAQLKLADEVQEPLLDRLAELEENAGAHALAMKAGKAMQAAETERADKAEIKMETVRLLLGSLVPSDEELEMAVSAALQSTSKDG